jgi:diguanylate cyclase (GGDEF)-like protein
MLNNNFASDDSDFQQAIIRLPQAILIKKPLGFIFLNQVLFSWTQSYLCTKNMPVTTENLVTCFDLDSFTKNNLKKFLDCQSPQNHELALTTHLITGQTLRWQWLADSTQLIVENITQWQKQMSELQTLSDTDPLTGLANRRCFQRDFSRLIAQGERNEQTGALILFDIDNLKSINDKWGHVTGDKVLSEFGIFAKPCIRPYECLARIGGDEFAIVTQHAGTEGANRVIQSMEAVFNKITLPDGTPLSASFGVALFNTLDSKSIVDTKNYQAQKDHIYSIADINLYKAKAIKK